MSTLHDQLIEALAGQPRTTDYRAADIKHAYQQRWGQAKQVLPGHHVAGTPDKPAICIQCRTQPLFERIPSADGGHPLYRYIGPGAAAPADHSEHSLLAQILAPCAGQSYSRSALREHIAAYLDTHQLERPSLQRNLYRHTAEGPCASCRQQPLLERLAHDRLRVIAPVPLGSDFALLLSSPQGKALMQAPAQLLALLPHASPALQQQLALAHQLLTTPIAWGRLLTEVPGLSEQQLYSLLPPATVAEAGPLLPSLRQAWLTPPENWSIQPQRGIATLWQHPEPALWEQALQLYAAHVTHPGWEALWATLIPAHVPHLPVQPLLAGFLDWFLGGRPATAAIHQACIAALGHPTEENLLSDLVACHPRLGTPEGLSAALARIQAVPALCPAGYPSAYLASGLLAGLFPEYGFTVSPPTLAALQGGPWGLAIDPDPQAHTPALMRWAQDECQRLGGHFAPGWLTPRRLDQVLYAVRDGLLHPLELLLQHKRQRRQQRTPLADLLTALRQLAITPSADEWQALEGAVRQLETQPDPEALRQTLGRLLQG